MKYSLIIAIENYCDRKISKVDYAENDLREFQQAIENIDYKNADSLSLLNDSATKTMIESKVRQLCRLVKKKDQIIFYYAGHGFANSGQNYITCYDTVYDDIVDTSIKIQFLFDELKNNCDNVIYFFDSCHSGFSIDTKMRGLFSDMNKVEYIEALKDKTYCIGFASCKTDEYSYPITTLKHGAWTYHLIESLNGLAPEALEKGTLLTAYSLQAYLSKAIPISLKKAYTVHKNQNPWIFGGSETDVILGDLGSLIKRNESPSPNIIDLEFEIKKIGSIKSLSGFKKFHTIPTNISHSTEIFVHSISEEELESETQKMYDVLRSSFGFKRKDLSLSQADGSRSILTPEFVVHLSIDQSQDDYGDYLKIIRLTEITNSAIIKNESFNDAFSDYFDTLIIKLDNDIDVEKLIDSIEDLENSEIELQYPADTSYCNLKVKKVPGSIRVQGDELIVEFARETRPEIMIGSVFNINEKLKQLRCEVLLIE